MTTPAMASTAGVGRAASPSGTFLHQEARGLFEHGCSDQRDRDPFPLPLVTSGLEAAAPKSRKSRARLQQRLAVNSRLRRLTWGVNQLAAGGPRRSGKVPADASDIPCIGAAPRAAQRAALQSLREHVVRDVVPDCLPAPSAALRELLKSADGGCNPCAKGTVAPFFEDGPSLPKSAGKPRHLMELLPPEWQAVITPELMLKPEAQHKVDAEALGSASYCDPTLKSSPALYAKYLCSLMRANMIRWDLQPTDFCPPFFVWKDDECTSVYALH